MKKPLKTNNCIIDLNQHPGETCEQALSMPAGPIRILRLREVVTMTGLSRSTIYDRINPKSPRHDITFPCSIRLGGSGGSGNAIGWLEHEVIAWIGLHAAANRKGNLRAADYSTSGIRTGSAGV